MIGNAAGSYSKGYGSRLPGAADVGYEGDTPAIENVMNAPEPITAEESMVASAPESYNKSLPSSSVGADPSMPDLRPLADVAYNRGNAQNAAMSLEGQYGAAVTSAGTAVNTVNNNVSLFVLSAIGGSAANAVIRSALASKAAKIYFFDAVTTWNTGHSAHYSTPLQSTAGTIPPPRIEYRAPVESPFTTSQPR
ncbi:hypothetical protein [Zhongshania borealis]|uniref:Uncharacterized protein n=1 Tax=Zhongshania borealis TaxID=889488 RepID=A0ABP7X8C1_9GAMM